MNTHTFHRAGAPSETSKIQIYLPATTFGSDSYNVNGLGSAAWTHPDFVVDHSVLCVLVELFLGVNVDSVGSQFFPDLHTAGNNNTTRTQSQTCTQTLEKHVQNILSKPKVNILK